MFSGLLLGFLGRGEACSVWSLPGFCELAAACRSVRVLWNVSWAVNCGQRVKACSRVPVASLGLPVVSERRGAY